MAITNADGSIILTTKIDTSGLNKGMKSLTSTASKLGGVLAGVFSVTKLIQFSKEASNLAIEQEANVQRLIDIYGEASNAVGDFIDQNARALGMSKASATAFSSVYGNLFSVWADQKTNAELTNRYLNMTAVIASKTGRTVADVQERIRSGLLGNTEAIEDLGVFVNVKTIEITEAFQRIADGRSWEQLTAYEQSQVRTLAILEQSTKKYGDQVADTTALTRSRFLASYQDMQATWGQFVNVVLVPVLNVVTKIMDIITAGMRAIAGLSGKTLESTESVSSSIGSSVDNQNDLTKAVKDTNKELKKSLASFDELNTLSQDTSGDVGGSAVGGAVSGIGDLGGTLDGSSYVAEVDETLTKIMAIAGMALVAIGLILLMTGNIAWGIGFIIAGVATFAVAMATLKDNAISQKVKDSLTNVVVVAGIVAIALGVIACIGGAWAIGVGLIISGAMAVGTTVALNWNGIKEALKGPLGTAIAIAGVVAIVFGVLACLAHQWALGIGLIVTGALSVGTTVVVNWDSIKEKVINVFSPIFNWVKTWGLLVLGIIMVITGVAFPLGLGLIYAGAKNLTTAKDPKWNALVEKVKATWKAVQDFWNANIAKYFTATWWGNLAKGAINGFLKRIVNGLNKLIDKLNSFGFTLPDVLGGGRVGFNISRLSVPQLAQGAVLPPNKPFLAMVGDQKHGTNIEAPADLIRQMAKEGMLEASAMMNNNGFTVRVESPIYLDSRQIALAVREAENNLGTQTVFGGFANAY